MNKTILGALALSFSIAANAANEVVLGDSSRVFDLDEVVVVQQSKEFLPLRQQPLSSTVLTATEANKVAARDIRELSSFVPSFVMPVYGSAYTPSVYVRGIGSRVNSPSVGFYVDGMPILSKSAFTTHLYELDRIDVLRGPQGTLYGLNTEGGMVRIYSKNPLTYQGTDVKISGGSRFYRNVEAAHYMKLGSKMALSVAGFYGGQNGFFRNSLTGKRADSYNEAGGKLRFVWQPTSRLSLDLIADYQTIDQKAYPYGTLNIESNRVASPDNNIPSFYERHLFNTGLNVKYIGDGVDLFSTTSYQVLKDNMLMDNDYTSIDFVSLKQRQLQNAISQELTLKSNRQGPWHWTTGFFASYQWLKTTAPVAFGSYMKTQMHMDAVEKMIYGQILQSMAQRMGEQGAAEFIARQGGVNIGVDMQVPALFHTPQFNMGLFHETNFDITPQLMATVGLRYDYTDTRIKYDTYGAMNMLFSVLGQDVNINAVSAFNNKESDHFQQLLPKFALTYKFPNGSNIYATVAKGYRAGGFNVQMFSDIIQADLNGMRGNLMSMMQGIMVSREGINIDMPHTTKDYENLRNTIAFKPETSWNYEVGSHLNLFGKAMHLDLSAFYMQITNQQLSVLSSLYGYGRVMVNAGKSYSCGVEAALRGQAFDDHLAYSLSYGYTHAAFKDYVTGEGEAMVDYKDKKVPFVPAHTLSAMADYTFDVNGSLLKGITIGANMNARGKTWWDEANTFSQKFYAVMGAHVLADCGAVSLNIWARNLTNTHYNTFAFGSRATGDMVYSAQQGNPFQIGADLKIHF